MWAARSAKPSLTAGFDITRPRYGQLLVQRIVGSLESDFHSVKLDSAEFVLNHGSAVVAGSLPIALNPAGIGPPDAPLSITADAHSVDLSALAPLLPGTGTKLTGTVDPVTSHSKARCTLLAFSARLGSRTSPVHLESGDVPDPRRLRASSRSRGRRWPSKHSTHAASEPGRWTPTAKLGLPVGVPDQGYAVNITAKGAQGEPSGVRRRYDRRYRSTRERTALSNPQRRHRTQ